MSIVQCPECGKEISDSAKTCPHCGARQKRKAGPLAYLIAGLFLIGLFQVLLTEREPPREKTEAERRADARYQAAHAVLKRLVPELHDPGSFELIEALTDETARKVCIRYRARNALGALVLSYLVVDDKGASTDEAQWDLRCSGPLYDVTSVKHLL